MANVLIESQTMTNIADAIREKNGSIDEYKPSEMPQAIKDIETTYSGNCWNDLSKLNLYGDSDGMKEAYENNAEYVIDVPPNVTSLADMFSVWSPNCYNRKLKKITINKTNGSPITNLASCFLYTANNRTVTLNFDTSAVTNFGSMFNRASIGSTPISITITTPLNFSSATNVGNMFGGIEYRATIKSDFRLVPETLSISWNVGSLNLTDETIKSIIDGLATVETQKTLTLNSAIVDRLTSEQIIQITNKNWSLG